MGTLAAAQCFRKPPLKANILNSWGVVLIRATSVRAIFLSIAFVGTLAPYRGFAEDGNQLPTKATKELPPQLLSLLPQRNMPKRSPILIRIFNEEFELEVWKQDTTRRFELLKVYPICRWSGDLGPKITKGDRQAPEGFYTITPGLINPNSNYYLAINTGFPNAYDRANDRHGGFLMIHGDCSSRGCYAMKAAGADCKRPRQALHSMLVGRWIPLLMLALAAMSRRDKSCKKGVRGNVPTGFSQSRIGAQVG